MKNLIFLFALFFAAFFNACQENSITDPITTENNIVYKINPGSNTIILDTWLLDPSQNPGPCSSLWIVGKIDFGVSSNIGNQIIAIMRYNTVVKMTINAELKPPSVPIERPISYTAPHYSVYEETLDYIMLDPVGAREYLLIKQYEITGCGSIHLVCTFGVTTTSVTLKGIRLCCDSQTIYPALD